MTPSDAPTPRSWWPVLAPPLVTALLTVAAQAVASEGFTVAGGPDADDVGFLAWGVSPAVGLVVLALTTRTLHRRTRAARTVLVVGGLLLLVATALMLWASLDSASSTAALGFLFPPLYGWGVVVLTALALGIVALVRRQPSPTAVSR